MLELLAKALRIEAIAQGLHAETAQQLHGGGVVLCRGIDHGAEAARVVEAQHALERDQVKVIVLTRRWRCALKTQTARHAQVQQQKALVQIEQQVFAAPAHGAHNPPFKRLRHATQRPTQSLAQAHLFDPRALDAAGKT